MIHYDTKNEETAHINNIDLVYETFGDTSKPAILLIQGAGNSMISWDAAFCQQLADKGRFVIRYDTRDTGRSTTFEVGNPPYNMRDLEADALGLLDALKIKKAHIVGLSQGSGVAQLIAIDHPDRVSTLTIISGTPGGPGYDAADLPPMTAEIAGVFSGAGPAEPDWNDADAVASYLVEGERPFAGNGDFDEEFFRATSKKVVARTKNLAAQLTNPFLIGVGGPWRDKLASLAVPTLIIHGETDPLFPIGHGEALAKEIKGAKLLKIKKMGHAQITPRVWSQIIEAISEHTM